MISVDIGTHRFQLRAAAVFTAGDFVLLHRLEGDAFWTLPGGRVEPGEDAACTLVREMREELGQEVVCGDLVYVVENFFEDGGRQNHELGLYFSAAFAANSPILNTAKTHAGVEGSQRLEFEWFAPDRLANIDIRPSFLRLALAERERRFRHVVQR